LADTLTPEARSAHMRRVRGADTLPERTVRAVLHASGFRFRLHRKDLPGRPDIVLPRYRTVVLVHGCFWHRHPGCRASRVPGTRSSWWEAKLERNVARDVEVAAALSSLGWRVVVVWECETRPAGRTVLAERLAGLLRGAASGNSGDSGESAPVQ